MTDIPQHIEFSSTIIGRVEIGWTCCARLRTKANSGALGIFNHTPGGMVAIRLAMDPPHAQRARHRDAGFPESFLL
jgi:hypothetical protein